MKRAFINIFILTVLLNVVSLLILPDKVAVHFGKGGRADSWASKELNCLVFIGIETLLFIMLWFSPALTLKTPYKWSNLPNKSFWLTEENKAVTKQKLESLMVEFGTAFMTFFLFIFLLTLAANLSEPVKLNEKLLFIFLGLFLIYMVYWSIKMYKSFRLPKKPLE